jgi:hypothetical protein
MKASKSISRIWILSLEITIVLIAGIIATHAFAAQVTLAWDPNNESHLAGYRIHYGTASGSYSVHMDVHSVTTYTVTGLADGQTYYFAATAYDASGNESGYSNPVSYAVPEVNGAPATPAMPTGASSALVNTPITFSTSATDPNGDSLQYRYDWGGDVLSNWGSASQSHSWSAAGQYVVKAQARDSQGAESAWSQAKTVTIAQSSAPVALDSDGDGVPDNQDAFPNDPKEWADANGNGTGDNADAATVKNKQTPNAPVLISPINDAPANTITELKTGAFHTAIAGTTHAKTRWQVFQDDDDACVLDIQSTTALTSLGVPNLVLEEDTPYFWRAQFVDSNGTPSEWSDYGYFSTQTTDRDRNANGIPDTQEVARTADLNGDRVKDYKQTSIKSVKMEGTNVQIGVSIKEAPAALAIESVESKDPNQLDASTAGKPESLPFGLIDFKIAVAKPGDRATVTLYFSKTAPSGSIWYMLDTVSNIWADFSAYANFAGDRRSVVLTLTDGGPGDADGIANGVIVDPGGIGVSNDNATQRSRRHR